MRDEHGILPVSSLIHGHFGLDNVCMGVPTIVGAAGAEQVLDIEVSEAEQKALLESAAGLKRYWQRSSYKVRGLSIIASSGLCFCVKPYFS